jgi:hypothetical protein
MKMNSDFKFNLVMAFKMFMSSREDWVPREDWAIVVEESRRVWRLAVLMRRDCGPKTFIP